MNKTKIALAKFIATGFYSGYVPKLPGTSGTVAAAVLIYLASISIPSLLTPINLACLAIATTLIGIWTCNILLDNHVFAPDTKSHKVDPQQIVIDEFAGYFFSLIFLPQVLSSFVVAFLLFRLFDITKPFPIKKLEALPKGWGIMADDVLAGLFAGVLGYFIC